LSPFIWSKEGAEINQSERLHVTKLSHLGTLDYKFIRQLCYSGWIFDKKKCIENLIDKLSNALYIKLQQYLYFMQSEDEA
jgi:hypothetical protein